MQATKTIPSMRFDDKMKPLISVLQKNIIMAEIGVFTGESTLNFLSSGKVDRLFAIDSWVGGYDPGDYGSDYPDFKAVEMKFDFNIIPYFNLVTKLKMRGEDAVKHFDDSSLDFVYIDANHTYDAVSSDINMWTKKIKKGGFIGGHDYRIDAPGVIKAVKEIFGSPLAIFPDSSWVKNL